MTRVLGVGLQSRAESAALAALLDAAREVAPDMLAILADKADHPALQTVQAAGLPVCLIARSRLNGVATPTYSARVAERFGTGSVAEALALVAAGPEARIVQPRAISPCGTMTTALADSLKGEKKE
ncbi:cobalamin biosynthesis protein [Thioclava litoralis]|uniref:Cobalamin biosynthesis protein n=1 Tax=Thioclava litoralis TaxID=3076557 RepID=A0ABZ1DYV6_9RHOB|nr:cobalamin biosynthesis protein [Thioclava sp. FTW29]